MSRINKFVRDIETSTNMLLETFGEMERSGIAPEVATAAPETPSQGGNLRQARAGSVNGEQL